MRKARGYSGEKASGLISIRIVYAHEHIIYDLLTLSDLLCTYTQRFLYLASRAHNFDIIVLVGHSRFLNATA